MPSTVISHHRSKHHRASRFAVATGVLFIGSVHACDRASEKPIADPLHSSFVQVAKSEIRSVGKPTKSIISDWQQYDIPTILIGGVAAALVLLYGLKPVSQQQRLDAEHEQKPVQQPLKQKPVSLKPVSHLQKPVQQPLKQKPVSLEDIGRLPQLLLGDPQDVKGEHFQGPPGTQGQNLPNSCPVNSIVQLLLSAPSFVKGLRSVTKDSVFEEWKRTVKEIKTKYRQIDNLPQKPKSHIRQNAVFAFELAYLMKYERRRIDLAPLLIRVPFEKVATNPHKYLNWPNEVANIRNNLDSDDLKSSVVLHRNSAAMESLKIGLELSDGQQWLTHIYGALGGEYGPGKGLTLFKKTEGKISVETHISFQKGGNHIWDDHIFQWQDSEVGGSRFQYMLRENQKGFLIQNEFAGESLITLQKEIQGFTLHAYQVAVRDPVTLIFLKHWNCVILHDGKYWTVDDNSSTQLTNAEFKKSTTNQMIEWALYHIEEKLPEPVEPADENKLAQKIFEQDKIRYTEELKQNHNIDLDAK